VVNLTLVKDWRVIAPAAGAAVVALAAAFVWMRKRPEDPTELERQRRVYLNRVGRIVEGQVLEINDPAHAPEAAPTKGTGRNGNGNGNHRGPESIQLVYYTYSISGVTYETAQDVTGLEQRLVLEGVVAGQSASVKYDPSNPSNSILLADDWSGLHYTSAPAFRIAENLHFSSTTAVHLPSSTEAILRACYDRIYSRFASFSMVN